MELRGDRRAADDRAALEDLDLQSGGGEIGRASEAVVAAADDDAVEDRVGRQGRYLIFVAVNLPPATVPSILLPAILPL